MLSKSRRDGGWESGERREGTVPRGSFWKAASRSASRSAQTAHEQGCAIRRELNVEEPSYAKMCACKNHSDIRLILNV